MSRRDGVRLPFWHCGCVPTILDKIENLFH